jgi:DNA polymerase bacteriophage-type
MFIPDELTWLDFESFGRGSDLKLDGTYSYASVANAIVCAYAIGQGPAQSWHADGAILDWNHAPPDLRAVYDRGTTFAAWHASFDAALWNFSTLGFPFLPPERVIDAMIQAGVSNLPTDLESASRYLGGPGKQKDGKDLIKLFCVEGAAPAEHPEAWQRFLSYARQDIDAMREVYRRTRPLPAAEWREYWAFEHVNRRGVAVDLAFVRPAAALAAEDGIASGRRLTELTDGAVTKVTQAKRIAAWLHDQLADAAMREVLMLGVPADDDDVGDDQEFSLTRDRVARVLAMLDAKRANGGLDPAETKAHEVATLRLYGAGASPKKFARLEAQQVHGVLRGQYRFSGAGQTGRMTSRGAQIQNLTRDVLGEDGVAEATLVDAIADGAPYSALVAAQPSDVPAVRKLALLVRPALVAEPGKVFIWSDWNAIEARVTPWNAASEGGEKVLDIFRANDGDPSRPDIYMIAAADVLHKNDPNGVTKSERAVGKVVVLSLGFGGSVGALKNMALNYRIHLDDAEARRIVDAWRAANPWAREFWGAHRDGESFGLWGAAMRAWEAPGEIATAGRLAFIYREDYLGGALFMALPSGRLLTYPRPRWRDVDILDRDGKPTGERRHELSFRRAHGRAKLWHGTLAENATQAVAADVLRQTVTRIENNPELAFMPIRMTTHDEIVVEVDEARAEEAKAILRREMQTVPDWAAGLPLQSEESVCPYYSKAKVALRWTPPSSLASCVHTSSAPQPGCTRRMPHS